MGIDGKDDLAVAACLKDVSVYSLYQSLHFLSYYSMASQCSLRYILLYLTYLMEVYSLLPL